MAAKLANESGSIDKEKYKKSEAGKRDAEATNLFKYNNDVSYRQNKDKLVFKRWFFVIICFILLFVVGVGMYAIVTVAQKTNTKVEDIGAVAASLGSILSVIIVLPSIVAKHLFPAETDPIEKAFADAVSKRIASDTSPMLFTMDFDDASAFDMFDDDDVEDDIDYEQEQDEQAESYLDLETFISDTPAYTADDAAANTAADTDPELPEVTPPLTLEL